MSTVDKRLRAHFGDDCGITVACEPTAMPALPAIAAGGERMLKVLIVDDEPLARENLRVLLQSQSDIEVVGNVPMPLKASVRCINCARRVVPRYSDAAHQRAGNGRHARPEHRPYIDLSDGL